MPNLGRYDLGLSPTVFSPEHVEHVDPRLTEAHEKVHRDLSFSSTYGFFSFIIAELASYHPDPIDRFRFSECKQLLVEHCRAPHEAAAYYMEEIDAHNYFGEDEANARLAASAEEHRAIKRIEAAITPLRLGDSLRSGMAYLFADLSLATSIAKDWSDLIPTPDHLKAYLQVPANNPNDRFYNYTKRAIWMGFWLRRRIGNTLTEFCTEQNVTLPVLSEKALKLDRLQVARLEYLLDESVCSWLVSARALLPIVPQVERIKHVEQLLAGWRSLLPEETSKILPDSVEFLQSTEFYDRSSAIHAPPPGIERLYKPVQDLAALTKELAERELCICLVSPSSYPRVEMQVFDDRRVPDGWAVLCIAIFDRGLPSFFEPTGYLYLGATREVLTALANWRHGHTVLLVGAEDVDERGGRILGAHRKDFNCSIRVIEFGLSTLSVPAYLASLGGTQFPVRAHSFYAGKTQEVRFLAAKTDEWRDLEFLAPITLTTFIEMQRLEYAEWISPKKELDDYETDSGQLSASMSACERLARFGFG